MTSKIIIGILLSACVTSCLADCRLEEGAAPKSYICEGIFDLQALNTIPEDAERISICDSQLYSLPENSFARFGSGLIYLNISNSQVSKMERGTFAGLSKLRDLILDHNEIKSIKTEWMENLSDLRTLRLYRNHITEIEDGVFQRLPRLRLLDLAFNQIDSCLSIESLKELSELRYLYITGNPWPLKCRPEVLFHLEDRHVQAVHTWGDSHILIAECLAHEIHAKYNDDILAQCVQELSLPLVALPLVAIPTIPL